METCSAKRQNMKKLTITPERLKEIRLSLHHTQHSMAKILGYSDGRMIRRLERGETRITAKTSRLIHLTWPQTMELMAEQLPEPPKRPRIGEMARFRLEPTGPYKYAIVQSFEDDGVFLIAKDGRGYIRPLNTLGVA